MTHKLKLRLSTIFCISSICFLLWACGVLETVLTSIILSLLGYILILWIIRRCYFAIYGVDLDLVLISKRLMKEQKQEREKNTATHRL